MLLNEPTPHQTRPAAATAAAAPGTRDLPAVEVDAGAAPPRASAGGGGGARASAEADTVAFTAVDGAGAGAGAGTSNGASNGASSGAAGGNGAATSNGASNGAGTSNGVHADRDADSDEDASADRDVEADGDSRSDDGVSDAVPGPRSSAEAPTVGIEVVDSGSLSTIALDVEAVKRAVAEGLGIPDATATVSLDVAAVKQATRGAEAQTVAFGPVDPADAEDELSTLELATDTTDTADDPVADSQSTAAAPNAADASIDPEATGSEPDRADGTDASAVVDTDGEAPATDSSTELVPSADDDLDRTMPTHIATTNLSAPPSGLVAVPETADDVIATIHAAATAVAAADRRARRAAFVKADPWTGLDLHRPPAPAPVDNVLDLLSPVLERPLLVVEQPGLPEAADVVVLHRAELAVDFVEPPVVAAGAEPPIPPRYGPGLSVLPHIEFPV
jgi:hypothetical protein